MRVVIIDDEQPAIDILEILLSAFTEVEIIGTYVSAEEAYMELENTQVDVVFLDMEMGDIHGLPFAERLMMKFPRIEVVFVTAHSQYALEAFEIDASDYLLKPVQQRRLEKAVTRLQHKKELYNQNRSTQSDTNIHLFARAMGSFYLFDTNQKEVKWRTRKVKELFVYLWHHQKNAAHRSRILEELWENVPNEKATVLMHTTFYQLRKKLKEIGIENPISLTNDKYKLNVSVQSDLMEMNHLLASIEGAHHSIERLIELYQGDYLEDEAYHWAQPFQNKTKNNFLRQLEKYLMGIIDDKEASYYIEMCLDKMIQLEPYNEKYVYLLLEYYGKTGKHEKMVSLFDHFKNDWIEELGIDVPANIVEVYVKYLT